MISLPWLFFGLCRDLPCFCYFFVSKHLYTFIYLILYVHIQQDQSVSFSLSFYFSLQAWIWSYFCRFHYSCLLVYFHKEFSWVVENYFELLILLSSPRIIGTSSHGYLSYLYFLYIQYSLLPYCHESFPISWAFVLFFKSTKPTSCCQYVHG